MAWGIPLTATASTALTAAQWNASVRDNLLETAPAKATVSGSHFVGAGPNVIAERLILDNAVATSETTTSTTYVALATNGPLVTVTTGAKALVWINSQCANSGTSPALVSYEVSGATTDAANDNRAILQDGTAGAAPRLGICSLAALTAGSNTFRMLYRVTANTGTFAKRSIQVMGL